MNATTPLQTLGAVCKRYGPGRLPGAERADVGAGYAGASAALFAAVAWMVAMVALSGFGPYSSLIPLAALGLYAIPLVVPVAFVAGLLVWRHLPSWTPLFGVVAGVLGTLATYLGAVAVLSVLFSFTSGPAPLSDVETAVRVAVAYGYVGFAFTFWIVVPVGAVSGTIYERVGVSPS